MRLRIRRRIKSPSKAWTKFKKNLKDIYRLLEIHEHLGGTGRGRRYGLEVINKSAVILLCAIWEAYVEDLADESFIFLINNSKHASDIPQKVLVKVSKRLIEKEDKTKIWRIADDGWKEELANYKTDILKKYLGRFHSPKSDNIDGLFEDLLGKKRISSDWNWPHRTADSSREQLDEFVTLRGELAHRSTALSTIRKPQIEESMNFVRRLGVKMNNTCCTYLENKTGKPPWAKLKFGLTK